MVQRAHRRMVSWESLGYWSDSSDRSAKLGITSRNITIRSLCWAITRDAVTVLDQIVNKTGRCLLSCFPTLIAGLASSVKRSTIWCSAVSGNVTQLAAGIAFHCLSLTIAGKMVWSSALVAGCWSWSPSKSTTRNETATISSSTTSNTSTAWNWSRASWGWAGTLL